MDSYKARREHNTKRVSEAFRAKEWKPSEAHHVQIKRNQINPHQPKITYHPKPHGDQFPGPKHEEHSRSPKDNPPHNPPMGGSPVTTGPKPKPKSPSGNVREEHSRPRENQKPANYVSPYTVTRSK
jgi:hypothetical protein